MFEVGSEFWTIGPEHGNGIIDFLPEQFNVKYTLCGRTALDIIIEDLIREDKIHSVYMPSYCCFTMIEPFKKHGIKVVFYDVIPGKEGIESNYTENTCDVVFLIDYFGYLSDKTLEFAKSEKKKDKTIIYDMTHSLFCMFDKQSWFDYVFGSVKKWMGVNAGFVAKKEKWYTFPELSSNDRFLELRNKAFDLKAEFIRNPESVDKNRFLKWFSQAEEVIESDYKYYGPDSRSIRILQTADIQELRKKRLANAQIIIDGLEGIDGVAVLYKKVEDSECPLFVPLYIADYRDDLRKYLISNNIYMPVHWPISDLHCLNSSNDELFRKELSCVCDQRYDEQDMCRIVEAIRGFFKNKQRVNRFV